jgi:hypothetical protein
MARVDEQDVELKPLDIEIAVGEDDLDRGVKLGIDGEPFWRVHITPDGQILVGDGFTYPLTPYSTGGGGGASTAADVALVDAGGNWTATDLEALAAEVADAFVAAGDYTDSEVADLAAAVTTALSSKLDVATAISTYVPLARTLSVGTGLSGGGDLTANRTISLGADLADLVDRWVPASAAGPASLDLAEDTDNGAHRARVIAPASMAADRVLTLPDATDTLLGLAQADARYPQATTIRHIVTLTQAAYDLLSPPASDTLYFVVEA